MSRDILQLLKHSAWADAIVWKEVLRLPAIGEHRLSDLLHHVHAVQCVYLQLVRGEAVEIPDPSSFDSPRALMASARECHRGQINTRIRELGGEPPLTDFIAWVWTGRPEAAWP